jgi:hypothetical protein
MAETVTVVSRSPFGVPRGNAVNPADGSCWVAHAMFLPDGTFGPYTN